MRKRHIALRLIRVCWVLLAIWTGLFATPQTIFADSTSDDPGALSSDQIGAFASGILFDDIDACSTTSSFGPGTLPGSVPPPYNAIFTAAATKYGISPAFLAAIFYGGEHGSSWPTPPSPYGSGPAWADSNVGPAWPGGAHHGAAGPFQFEYGTWKGYGVDGNGDGNVDVEDLKDAAFGSANYLTTLGAKGATDEAKLRLAAAGYNGGPGNAKALQNGSYANNVWAAFQKFGGANSSTTAADTNPTTNATADDTNADTSGGSTCGTDTTTTDCTGNTGNAPILCEAKKYSGIYYQYGGGHNGYNNFRKQCPENSIRGAAVTSTATHTPGPCATDCSGLVSMALDAVYGQEYDWDVSSLEHSSVWPSIHLDSLQPGDVVTIGAGHVEIFDRYSDSTKTKIYTFGSHQTGEQTNEHPNPSSISVWDGAYHYTGSTTPNNGTGTPTGGTPVGS